MRPHGAGVGVADIKVSNQRKGWKALGWGDPSPPPLSHLQDQLWRVYIWRKHFLKGLKSAGLSSADGLMAGAGPYHTAKWCDWSVLPMV